MSRKILLPAVMVAVAALSFFAGRHSDSGAWWPPRTTRPPSTVPRSDGPQSGKLSQAILAKENPAGFDALVDLRKVLGERNPQMRQDALKQLAALLASKDPLAAWELLPAISGLADRQVFSAQVMEIWVTRSPLEALSAASALPGGELQAVCLSAAIGIWARSSPQEAVNFATRQLTGSGRQMALSSAVREWASQNPVAAARWSLANSQNSLGIQAVREIMSYWAQTDPQTGVAWALSLKDSPFKSTALQSVLMEWTDQFPEEASGWLSSHPQAHEMTGLVAANWSKSDPLAAANWARSLPPGTARDDALRQTVAAWAAAAPVQALEWISSQPGPDTTKWTRQAIKTWSYDDPKAAYEWAASQPEGAPLAEASVEAWAENNPESFATWARVLPESARTDPIRKLHSIILSGQAPGEAAAQANGIRDPALRAATVEQVLAVWQKSDPKAVSAWRIQNPSTPP